MYVEDQGCQAGTLKAHTTALSLSGNEGKAVFFLLAEQIPNFIFIVLTENSV
jgi:hypothetical protein